MQNPIPFRIARAVLVVTLLVALAAAPGAAWAAPAGADGPGVRGLWQQLTVTVQGWMADLGSGFGLFAAATNGGGTTDLEDPSDQAGLTADPNGLTSQGGIIADPDGISGQAGLIADPDGVSGQAGIIADPNG